jgi:hypothetical protein
MRWAAPVIRDAIGEKQYAPGSSRAARTSAQPQLNPRASPALCGEMGATWAGRAVFGLYLLSPPAFDGKREVRELRALD